MGDEPVPNLARSLSSVCAVTVTPLTSEGAVDEASVRRLARHAAAEGAGVLTVGGSVGEFMSLDANERHGVVAATVDAVGGDVPVIAAIGGDLASAVREGIDATAAGPFRSPTGWVTYHERLANELAPHPIVLYLRDPAIGVPELDSLTRRSPNVLAVKHAVADPAALAALTASLGDRLVWLCGLAESLAPFAWLAGATGFTSGLANVSGWLPRAMLEAMRRTDFALVMDLWRRAAPFEALRARRAGAASVGVVKAALASRGVIAHATVRPPLEPLDASETADVARLMNSLGGQTDFQR
jgi:4-hydroxy-tetrahydrodipicolinate synthase